MASEESVLGISVEARSNLAAAAQQDAAAVATLRSGFQEVTTAAAQMTPALTPVMQVVAQLAQTYQLTGTEASAAFRQMAQDAGISVGQAAEYFAKAQATGQSLAESMAKLETGAATLQPKFVLLNGTLVDLNANFVKAAQASTTVAATEEEVVVANNQVAQSTGRMAIEWGELSETIRAAQAGEISLADANEELGLSQLNAGEAAGKSSNAHVNLFETMRGGRMMIAGLLADMALMNIAMGEQVPAATRAAVKEIQVVIDTSVAMAFAFDAFGIATAGAGLALGALIGVGEVAFTLLSSGSASVGELNKQLDSLAKKDEVTTTLAGIAKSSQDDAAAMLAAAKASPEFAAALRDTTDEAVRAQAALSGLPDVMGGVSTAADKIGTNVGILTTRLEGNITAIRAWVAGSMAYQDTIRAGGTQIDAFIAQVKASDAVLQGNADALNRVAEAAAGLQRLRIEADTIDSYKALDTAVANLAKRDDAVQTFAQITGYSENAAQSIFNLAKQDQTFADQLNQTLPLIEHLNTQIQITREMGGDASEAQRELGVVLQQLGQQAEDAAGRVQLLAQVEALMTVVPEISTRMASDAQKIAADQQRASEDVARAQQQAADESARAWRTYTEQMGNLAFQRSQQAAAEAADRVRIERETTDAINRANQQMNDSIADANRTLNEALAKDAQTLADRQYDAGVQLADKLSDIAHREVTARRDIQNQIIQDRQDLANKIADIERRMWEDIANAAWQAGLDVEKAKTQNEADSARERYLHEAGLIEQRANDQTLSAEQQFAKEMQLEAQKMAKLTEDSAYQRAIAERTYGEELARAQRTYVEEVEAARQRNADQVADAQRRNAEEVAAARLRNQEQLNDLAVRVAAENRALDNQAAQIHQRYIDQEADLALRLQEQVNLIAQRYNDEIKAIDVALIAFMQAESMKMQILEQRFALQAMLNAQPTRGAEAVGGPGGYGLPGGPARQAGGPVEAGQAVVVGERGPEVFAPNRSGLVYPSVEAFMGARGGTTVNFSPTISIAVTATDGPDVIATIKSRSRELTDTIMGEYKRGMENVVWQ